MISKVIICTMFCHLQEIFIAFVIGTFDDFNGDTPQLTPDFGERGKSNPEFDRSSELWPFSLPIPKYRLRHGGSWHFSQSMEKVIIFHII